MDDSNPGVVCIIDDDDAVREALRILLFSAGLKTVQYASGDDFLQDQSKPEVDTILLDIRMPGTDGTELHEILIEEGNQVPVIFITGHGDIPLAVNAMQRGAVDFLVKPLDHQELIEKIRDSVQVYRDKSKDILKIQKVKKRLGQLTKREKDVLAHLVQGLSNKAIATELRISPRTVEIHRSRVMEKTGSDSVAALVTMVNLARD